MAVALTAWTLAFFAGCSPSGGSGGGGGTAKGPVDAGTEVRREAGAPDAAPPYASGRVAIPFDLDWKYLKGAAPGADAVGYDDSSWAYVDLPHSTDFVTPENTNAYLGIAWYRKHFTVDGAFQGAKVFVEFEAAMQQADVWVNGVHLIQHQGGYAPFTIDVTQAVNYGGTPNVIAVQINTNANPSWAPGWNGVDFQYHGGLYRNVNLYVTNPLHVTEAVFANKVAGGGVFVTYESVTAASATVHVATDVANEAQADKVATVVSALVDAAGQTVGSATTTSSIAAGSAAAFTQTISVANPRLWHPYTPYLYTLVTTVQDGAATVDRYATRAGIRTIQWTHAGGLSINGAPFEAIGANVHQETYGLGNAVPNRAIYYDVKRLKDGGLNFIRGSHYPHSPAFYDACDALGVLVMDAQTGWQLYEDTPAFNASTYQELRDMIRRDRNHPSVVAWEASLNESNYTDAWAQAANAIVHQEYPGEAYSAQWILARSDIAIGSSQAGIRNTGDVRPIVVDEYGDWDYGQANSTSRQAREAGDNAMLVQAANVADGTSLNLALPWYSVGSYWDYADYGGFTTYGVTRCGLVDMYRLPKFAYYFLQSQRDPSVVVDGVDSGPVVYIANQWTPTSPTTVRVYGNCDQVELSLDGAPVATLGPNMGTSLAHPPFDFPIGAFTPGTLQADCFIGGVAVATATRSTPGAAVGIALRPEAFTLDADGSDARLVFIDVLDANGTVVVTDESQVTVTVAGPGRVVGPSLLTMKGGELATWVRSERIAGTITLTASGPGLASASVDLLSNPVTGLPPVPSDRDGGS